MTRFQIPQYAKRPHFNELLDAAAVFFEGSIYIDEDIVLCQNILTAKPRVPQRFAEEIIRYLNL